MKLFFRIIFKIFLILTILAGYATARVIKETDSDALLNQGIVLLEKGRYDLSINCFNKAIEINPRYAEAYNHRGLAYGMGKGQYDKAIADFNKAIEINPRFAEAYSNCGITCRRKGQHNKAIADFTKAIEINPRFAEAYNNRAFVNFYKRDYEKAWDDVYKALNLGYKVHPGFLNALRQASGREK